MHLLIKLKKILRGFSRQANYTDRATPSIRKSRLCWTHSENDLLIISDERAKNISLKFVEKNETS